MFLLRIAWFSTELPAAFENILMVAHSCPFNNYYRVAKITFLKKARFLLHSYNEKRSLAKMIKNYERSTARTAVFDG